MGKMARLFISAAHKSSGKTTLSIGLCAALSQRGIDVQPFKKGPDYIDPLWLSAASQNNCYNLDFNTMSADEILCKVQGYSQQSDISLIEANKGLFDGVALDGSDSNAALAHLTRSPVVLVIDTRGMTRGIAPLLMGYQAFDDNIQIAGVILNRVGGQRHASKLQQSVEHYTDIPVLGAVQNNRGLEIEERHLGLMPSNERHEAQAQIDYIANLVAQQVDLDKVMLAARSAQPLNTLRFECPHHVTSTEPRSRVRIGICQDSAFGFYYPDDLEALAESGADLVSINTLSDTQLPQIDGLFIGGGFPETHLQKLSKNIALREQIQSAIEKGMPCYAECGGLMYLSRSIKWQEQTAEMVGVIPADAVMHKKPQGRGHVRLKVTDDMPWKLENTEAVIQAHEFHYSNLENLEEKGRYAYQVLRGSGITGSHDGWVYKNLLASYAHMRDSSKFRWAQSFVNFVRERRVAL